MNFPIENGFTRGYPVFFWQLHIKPTLQYPAFSWHWGICYESWGDIVQLKWDDCSGWYRQWLDRLESKRYPKSSLPWNKLIDNKMRISHKKPDKLQKRWYEFQKRWCTPRKLLKKNLLWSFAPCSRWLITCMSSVLSRLGPTWAPQSNQHLLLVSIVSPLVNDIYVHMYIRICIYIHICICMDICTCLSEFLTVYRPFKYRNVVWIQIEFTRLLWSLCLRLALAEFDPIVKPYPYHGFHNKKCGMAKGKKSALLKKTNKQTNKL